MRDFVVADPELLNKRRRLLKASASRTMAVPPDVVWRTLADHESWSTWHADYEEHRAITEKTSGLGARFRTKEWILVSESEITRWEPGSVIGLSVLRAVAWRWLLRSHYSELRVEPVEDDPQSTMVHYQVAFTGTILFWILSAYTIGYSLVTIHSDARSSLKKLEQVIVDGQSA